MKPGNPRREGGKKEGGRGMDGREGCDGNYEVGAYGMEWVHNREPDGTAVLKNDCKDCPQRSQRCGDEKVRKDGSLFILAINLAQFDVNMVSKSIWLELNILFAFVISR